MKINFCLDELKYYISKRKNTYITSLIFVLVGIVIGVFIASSSDRFLSLIKSDDKILFDYINGKVSFSKQFFRLLLKFVLPMVVVFLLTVSSYSSFLGYVFLAYNGALFFLNTYAVIVEFGLIGVLSFIFLILPVNVILFLSIIFYYERCLERCKLAKRQQKMFSGFVESNFWMGTLVVFGVALTVSVALTFINLIVLKNYIFMIY